MAPATLTVRRKLPNKDLAFINSSQIIAITIVADEQLLAKILADSCSGHCQSGSHGDGVIIGTAPFCGGNCKEDCPGRSCYIGTSNWADYGSGCWSGNKVCCCVH